MTQHSDDKPIVRTARQARQAERGPTVLNILIISMGLAVVTFATAWLLYSS